MAKPFSVPFNVPKGTSVADGYRIAPDFDFINSSGNLANNIVLSGASYKNYGPGMEVTPLNTWNITPYGLSGPGNIVADGTVVTGSKWLTLASDGFATTLMPPTNSIIFPFGAPQQSYIQFDWPRVPTILVDGSADLAGPVNVTFFGTDWYGMPLQHTYVVEARGIYPGDLFNAAGIKAKAFYRITGVYFAGATPAGCTISCQASNTFGLPYVLKGYRDISLFRWNEYDMLTQGGIAKLGQQTPGDSNVVVNTPVVQALVDARATAAGPGFPTSAYQTFAPSVSLSRLTSEGVPGELSIGTVTASTQATRGWFEITSSTAAGGDTSVVSWSIPNAGYYLVKEGDRTTPSSTSGDVRGLFQLPFYDGTNVSTWNAVPNGEIAAVFTWYCEGFDQWLNILNAGGQPQGPGPVPGIVPANTVVDMYGLEQYYTGVPLP